MIYRKIEKEESLGSAKIKSMAFGFGIDGDEKSIEEDKYLYEFEYGAFDENKKQVATVTSLPFDMYLDGHSLKCSGVAGVATLPENRRGGHIKKIFAKLFQDLIDEDYSLSYLFPFSHEYYRKFGYEFAYNRNTIKAPLEELLRFGYSGHATQFLPGEEGTDPEDIINIYNSFAPRMNYMLDRDAWWWERKLEKNPYKSNQSTYIWYNDENVAKSYFTMNYNKDNRESMSISDIAWTNSEGLYGMLGFLGRLFGNYKTVEFNVAPILLPEFIWREANNIETTARPGGMARLINVEKTLEAMKKPEIKSNIIIDVKDEFLSYNNTKYSMDIDGSTSNITKNVTGNADLVCSVEALSQLVSGMAPLSNLMLRKDIVVNSKIDDLKKIFVKKDVFTMDGY